MSGERRFGALLYATVISGSMLYCVAAANVVLALLVLGIASIAALMTNLGSGRTAPRSLVNLMLTFALGWAVRGTLDERIDVDDFCEFIAVLALVKLFDLRSPRDHAQALTLGVLLGVGAVLTSNALPVGMMLVAFVPLVCVTTVRHQIRAGAWSAGVRRVPRSVTMTRDLRRLLAGGLAGALVVSIGVFLVFPRGLGDGAFGNWGNASVGRTSGFADEVELGVGGLISESPTPVLDLRVTNGLGENLGGPDEDFYLRGAVLDEYEDGRWRHAGPHRDDASASIRNGRSQQIVRIPQGERLTIQNITIRNAPRNVSHLFSVWRPAEIEAERRATVYVGDGDAELRLRRSDSGRFAYRVVSIPQRGGETGERRGGISFDSDVVRGFAEEALGNRYDPDPEERPRALDAAAARRIEFWLQNNLTYRLDTLRSPSGREPIEWFLTDARAGHCEYFASAMAAMCRSIGIDARVVTGYYAVEWNPDTGYYVVRESNAHAWVEVEVGEGNWAQYDPTPEADLTTIHRPDDTLLGRVRRAWGTVEHWWNSGVVSYDTTRRADLLGLSGSVSDFSGGWMQSVRYGGAPMARRALTNGLLVFIGAVMIGFSLRAVTARWLARRRRVRGVEDPGVRRLVAGAGFYFDALRELERRGLGKPGTRPPLDHADRIGGEHPDEAGGLRALAGLYYRLRFGGAPLSAEERASADEALGRLRSG